MHCLHILVTVSELMLYKYVVQLVLTLIWGFPGVQCSVGLLKPCVVDDKAIPSTNIDEHLTCLRNPSQSVSSRNVSVWFFTIHTVPVSHFDGVCLTFSILFKNFFSYIVHFVHMVILIFDIGMYTWTNEILAGSVFNSRTMILSLHTVFLTSFHTLLVCTATFMLLLPL